MYLWKPRLLDLSIVARFTPFGIGDELFMILSLPEPVGMYAFVILELDSIDDAWTPSLKSTAGVPTISRISNYINMSRLKSEEDTKDCCLILVNVHDGKKRR